jgi:hypothetical protein
VALYFTNYAREEVRLAVGRAEGRDVLAAYTPASGAQPEYIIALETAGDRVSLIRDWRYAPYVMRDLAFEGGEPA